MTHLSMRAWSAPTGLVSAGPDVAAAGATAPAAAFRDLPTTSTSAWNRGCCPLHSALAGSLFDRACSAGDATSQ